jgi:hypothetical protein
MTSRIALFESLTPMMPWKVLVRYFTSPSGPIYPRASAAHGETYSTSVFGVSPYLVNKTGTSIQIAATTTKICASWIAPLVLTHSVSPARFFATTTPTYSMYHSRKVTCQKVPERLIGTLVRNRSRSLEFHPFSGLVHSAGELLHTP